MKVASQIDAYDFVMSNSPIFQNPKSGSIKATGTFDIVDEQGKVIKTVTDPKFCGCGLSQDKPLCDKSHANYVNIVVRMLEDARESCHPITPMGTWAMRAFEIRKRQIENRILAGEKLVGVKFGGALLKGAAEPKQFGGMFGYLTDVMQIDKTLELKSLIAPKAEAEVVFRLSKDLDKAISIAEVPEYISEVSAGIEVFDTRYSGTEVFIDDAVADNACAGAFAVGAWRSADEIDFNNATISIFEDGRLVQEAPASAIAGNPWAAVVNTSKLLADAAVVLPAGSIIFSGSATQGIPIKTGQYLVRISGLDEVSFNAN